MSDEKGDNMLFGAKSPYFCVSSGKAVLWPKCGITGIS